ncbi:hypothetical protein A8709_13835 [Paenibacillus pectinilyticus]|uniref:Histidine kinase/HSP90-like ATPase domain-containing protein n=1 Tax=Paenibacillus pectinilyticus TaxID=512399 RepID=A0A1C1A3P1_9BACL|nr:sensor histidine kinase [Paenibacillus pectinilyticus]OCT15179.1 hypothetical protein A8709_13835 [Paenibacillus pectinilyticus]
MYRAFKKWGIKTQLMILILVSTVFIMLTQAFSYWQMSETISARNDEYLNELLVNVSKTIENNFNAVNRIMTSTAYNDLVQRYLMEEDPTNRFLLNQSMVSTLENVKPLNRSIVDFVLIGKFGNDYNVGYDPSTRAAFQAIINRVSDKPNQVAFRGINNLYFKQSTANYVVAELPIRGVNSGLGYGLEIGHLFILLDTQTIIPQIESNRTAGMYYVLDTDDVVISSNNQLGIGKKWEDISVHNSVVRTKDIPDFGFKLVSVIPNSELYRGMGQLRLITAVLVGIMIILMYGTYLAIGNNIMQPIKTFVKYVNNIKSKNEDILKDQENLQLEGYAEIGLMATKFNQLMNEKNELTQHVLQTNSRIYELELLKKQAELAYLNSQINPHFLYNTLECIQGIASVKGVHEIQRMTAALSQIFRYSIKGEETVSLSEELRIVKHYISIQLVRFQNRFDVHYDIPEQLLSFPVKKMILQPIVENAIFHGIEMKSTKGNLWIEAKRNPYGDVEILIKDDGVGIRTERLHELKQRLNIGSDEELSGMLVGNKQRIGISNVNQRLKVEYGFEYGITIHSTEHEGTKVLLTLPQESVRDERIFS